MPFLASQELYTFNELLSNLCLPICTYSPRFVFFMISLRSESAMVEKTPVSG